MIRKGYVDSSDNVRLYYEVVGSGESPLVMLNGGPGLSHTELKELRFLSKYTALIYFDQRGTGKSSKTDPEKYTIRANVQDIENLREKLCLDSVSLFGFSWGAALALQYALTFPRNVKKLILVGAFSSASDIGEAFESMRSRASKEVQGVLKKCERDDLYKEGKYSEEYLRAVQPIYEPYTINSPVPNYLMKVFNNLDWEVYRAVWGEKSEFKVTGALREFDVRDRLQQIDVPVLMIIGDSDFVPKEIARRDALKIRNAKLVILENAKHFCFIDQRREFENAVSDFLKETG